MNGELGRGVVISSAADIGALVLLGTFVDDQATLAPLGVDTNGLSWLQLSVTLGNDVLLEYYLYTKCSICNVSFTDRLTDYEAAS